MEEQEYSQDNQTSLLGYLKSMGETRDILRWCLCEFVNDTARTFIRRLLIWSVLSRAVSLAYPYLMGLGIDGLYQHNLTFAIFAVVGIALTYVLVNLLVDLAYGWLDPRIRYE